MLARVIRRAAAAAATVLVVAVGTFILVRSVPGGPFSRERRSTPEVEARLAARYGLDAPAPVQFVRWLGNALHGDLGPSFTQPDRTVNDVIREGLPRSAALGGAAFALALALGIPSGVLAALASRRRGNVSAAHGKPRGSPFAMATADRALAAAAVVGVSLPSFLVASLLQYVFAYRLDWLPAAGWGDTPSQMLMPAASLAAFPAAFLSRLVRQSLLETLKADYVRTARAKGLSAAAATLRHALRNALLPAVTYSGPLLAGLLVGSFVVEDIFAIPGLGKFFVSSIQDRDYTVLLGVTVFYATFLVTLNLLVDAAYSWLDPRIGGAGVAGPAAT